MTPAPKRLEFIKEKLAGTSVSTICRRHKISRFTFYKWFNLYKKNPVLSSLEDRYIKGNKHWKKIPLKIERQVNEYVIAHPDLSISQLEKFLRRKKIRVSHHGIQNILHKLNLNNIEKRINQQKEYYQLPISYYTKSNPEYRFQFIQKALNNGEKISSVCRKFNISRFTYYKWVKRFKKEESDYQTLLSNQYIKGYRHWKSIPEDKIQGLLNIVISHPEYSVGRLYKEVGNIGHHGIQNILEKKGLSYYKDRLAYSQAQEKALRPTFIPKPTLFPIYNLTLRLFRMLIAPFVTIPKNKFSFNPELPLYFSATFITTFLFSLYWIKVIGQAQSPQEAIGLIFASIALTIGTFFFLYSMKYYLTLALVLGYSRQDRSKTGEVQPGFVDRIFGRKGDLINNDKRASASGLQPDISKIQLERHPFVSVHLASYNEKRVINRLLTAATSFDYPNYEVILVDDSSDPEAVSIVNEWRGHPRLKIIQRKDRVGFKGGALEEARKITDSQAEFVLVFDSDFIPYPDSITQFVKYFKAVGGWEENQASSNQRLDANLLDAKRSNNIAAVQGYQWHVLNKSENWITRGVRSEYAGSYVIERSGEEIYGGLKQISGSVYMIKRKVLDSIKWGVSITEDFELTLKLYEKGYKVVYTPYIQAPSECVSTLKRLIRQRMRWAEGHSHNIKRMFNKLMFRHSPLTKAEKFEFLYLSPYYLQSAFFVVGTLCWFTAEVIFRVRLPFWTAIWGWSLVLTNLFALPLLNMVGLFLEEAEERDYLGIFSFIVTSYLLAPFQAYASVKGFIEKEEGPWFRTPKTGKITDTLERGKFYRWLSGFLPRKSGVQPAQSKYTFQSPAFVTASNQFNRFSISRKQGKVLPRTLLMILLLITTNLVYLSPSVPVFKPQPALAQNSGMILNNGQPVATPAKQTIVNRPQNAKPFQVLIKANSKEKNLLTLVKDDYQLAFGIADNPDLTDLQPVNKEDTDNGSIFKNIANQVDLKFSQKDDQLLEEFIVKDRQTAGKIDRLNESVTMTNLEYRMKDDGSIDFLSAKNQKIVFVIPKPVMYEYQNQDNKNYGLHYELKQEKSKLILSKVLDQAGKNWLLDPDRQYPVVIDATVTIDTSTSSSTTAGSWQRKTFYDSTNSRYWAFNYSGTDVDIWYSSDGASWTEDTSLAYNTRDFSLWWADVSGTAYVWIAYANGSSIAVRRGTLGSSSITWDASSYNVLVGGRPISYADAYLSRDSSGYLWVVGSANSYLGSDIKAVRSSSPNDPSAWGTAIQVSANPDQEYGIDSVIVPLASQHMYIVYNKAGGIKGCIWDNDQAGGARWEDSAGNDCTNGANIDSIDTGYFYNSPSPRNISAVVDPTNNYVHLIYTDSSGNLSYKKYDGSAWDASHTHLDANTYCEYGTISLDTATNDLYAFWIRSSHIYYKKATYSAGPTWTWDTDATDWKTTTNGKWTSSNYSGNGKTFVMWTEESASPYNVNFDSITAIPEKLWSIIVIELVGIGWLRRRRKKPSIIFDS